MARWETFWKLWVVSVVTLTIVAACSREDDVSNARSIANKLVYTKDNRTGLCFAIYEAASGYRGGITEVPCDKVQNELDK